MCFCTKGSGPNPFTDPRALPLDKKMGEMTLEEASSSLAHLAASITDRVNFQTPEERTEI